MTELIDYIKIAFCLLGAFLSKWLGGIDSILIVLISFSVIDYITGVFVGFTKNKLSSKIGAKGIVKKITIYLVVAIAFIFDKYVMKGGNILRTATIFFYISNETISILENIAYLGVPIPQKLKDILLQYVENKNTESEEKKE